MNTTTNKVTKVPSRVTVDLKPYRGGFPTASGWGVFEFTTPREAAAFVQTYPTAAMPCWRRWEIVDGELVRKS